MVISGRYWKNARFPVLDLEDPLQQGRFKSGKLSFILSIVVILLVACGLGWL